MKATLFAALLTLLLAVPATATIGLVEAPHWVEDGLCVELTTTDGATVAVTGARWEPIVAVSWDQGDASATDPECTGSEAVRTSLAGETEVWKVFVPVPCLNWSFWSTRARDLYVYEGWTLLMSFDMGRKPADASGTCLE